MAEIVDCNPRPAISADETGSVLVETAFTVTILALFAIGVVQIGLYAWQSMQLEAAVQAGALYATQYTAKYGWNGYMSSNNFTTSSAVEIESIVERSLTGVAGTIQVSPSNVTARWGCQSGASINLTGPVCTSSGCPAAGSYTCGGSVTPGIYVSITATLTSGSMVVSRLLDLSGILLYPITRTTVVRIQ